MRIIAYIFFSVLLGLMLTGCWRSVALIEGPEHLDPLMRQASALEQAGEPAEAAKIYHKILLKSPGIASAYLQLALIYHEHLKDYIEAIHYYRRYIDLRPTSDKVGMIEGRIERAEQLLAAQSVRMISANDPSGQVALMRQIDRLNSTVAKYEAEKKELTETNAVLTSTIESLNGRIRRLELWVDRLQSAPEENTEGRRRRLTKISGGDSPGSVAGRTYEVRPGDSLSRIADFVYGDPTQWPRIKQANPSKISSGDRVRVGDILVIP
jgi:tetratricopeptide (TPR) repeat protein